MPVDLPVNTLPGSLLRKFERRGGTALPKPVSQADGVRTFIDELLAEQHKLTAVERFSQAHDRHGFNSGQKHYRKLLPARSPSEGEQYNFEVDLDKCSGCKACVSACHSLNGLEEGETWRSVGLLVSVSSDFGFQQHVTTACHHCVDPGCLNGCPVLAYDKDPVTGIVRHLNDQCMGCTYCVMKCPYEVPKYSSRLGIVRKCDMCANRLGTGEAPACVQGCPNEAIRITLVKQDEVSNNLLGRTNVREALKGPSGVLNPFFPDSPDPRLTLPATRYVSRRGLPESVFAADHCAPRLDPPHWPLVFMLVLTQSAAGMFLAGAAVRSSILDPDTRSLSLTALVLLCAGLVASVLHLGRPLKAWRAFLGWRRSWLSREIIALNLFAVAAGVVVSAEYFRPLRDVLPQSVIFASFAGLIGVFASAMVYVDTGRPLWTPRFAFGNFFGTTLLLGSTFAACVFAWGGAPAGTTQTALLTALTVRTALFAWRRLGVRAALRNTDSPIHFNARVIRELLPWIAPVGTWLFALSTGFNLLAAAIFLNAAPWWTSLAALTTFGSEIIARYVFFAAGGSKRMPGGIAA